MQKVQGGDTVMVHYIGTLNDGQVFDSSEGKDPLQFTVGAGQVIPGFEAAIVGMAVGESKTVNIPSDEAYGPYRDDLLIKVDRAQFPSNIEPEIGMALQVMQQDGQPIIVEIKGFNDAEVTLDANHSLAGKDLIFKLSLDSIL